MRILSVGPLKAFWDRPRRRAAASDLGACGQGGRLGRPSGGETDVR